MVGGALLPHHIFVKTFSCGELGRDVNARHIVVGTLSPMFERYGGNSKYEDLEIGLLLLGIFDILEKDIKKLQVAKH